MVLENLSWFYFSITATFLFGISTALYKIPSAKNLSKLTVAFWMMLIQFILSIAFFYKHLSFAKSDVIFFALLWGASYAVLTIMQMYALSHLEINTLAPVTTILSLVLTVITGLILFKDKLSFLQFLGIILVIITVYMFIYKKGKLEHNSLVIILGTNIVLFSAFNKIIQKFGTNTGDIFNLQIYSYFFAALSALLAIYLVDKKDFNNKSFKNALKPGMLVGIVAFLGGYAILTALSRGPFPLITAIHSLYIFVSAILGYFLFKEKLTLNKILLLFLAIAAVLLIRLG